MKKSNKTITFIKTNKYKVIIGLVVIFLLYMIFGRGSGATKFETAVAAKNDVIETVSVTGTVSPFDKADLSFEKGGVVRHIYVKVGDQVRAGDQIAVLDNAGDSANYQSAAATLSDLSRNLRPEEQSVELAKLSVARVSAVNAAHDAYAEAQSAMVSYIDSLWSNAGSINPILNIPTDSYASKTNIQTERVAVTEALSDWANDLQANVSDDPTPLISKAQAHLAIIRNFMNDFSAIVGSLTTANSGLSQATVNNYIAIGNSALSAVNQASNSLTNSASALAQANSNYSLKVAGNSSDAIAAQRAKVNQASAELAKDTILSPIDGIVTKVTPNEGEFVGVGQPQFSVQSNGNYKIEANVPEADIAKIALSNYSSTTLDAYGSNTYFGATVAKIDPAETVIEGVPTYKVTLYFSDRDERIRSGMTANLEILTHKKTDVVAIPYRAIIDTNGSKFVRVVKSDNKTYSLIPVVAGLKGSSGTIEILSGVKVGDRVVTYIK